MIYLEGKSGKAKGKRQKAKGKRQKAKGKSEKAKVKNLVTVLCPVTTGFCCRAIL
jgi:uncharacterized protein YjbJ (UPF0337 family)